MPNDAPLTEPTIIPCPYVNGMQAILDGPVLRFVGWTTVPAMGGETDERRICIRFAMPVPAVRECQAKVAELVRNASVT